MSVNPTADYFLDTNILVYAYDLSAGQKHLRAAQLIEECWENENGCLSLQVLQEFFVTVTQKISPPLDHHVARQIVADLTHWRLHAPDADDLLQAIDYKQNYQLSFWDALIIQSAACLGCEKLFSEDLIHDHRYGDVHVINPFLENV